MNIDELKARITEIENELGQEGITPQRREELSNMLSRPETGLRAQLKKLTEQEHAIEQKKEELQDFVVSRDYNTVLGNPKANAIIHTLLGDQAEEYERRIAELGAKLEAVTKQGLEAEDKAKEANELLTEASDENTKLLGEKEEIIEKNIELQSKIDGLLSKLEQQKDDSEDIAKLKERLDEELKESRYHKNENAQLVLKMQSLERELEYLKKQKEQFKSNQKLDELLKDAQEYTNQNKKKPLMNIRQVDKTHYAGVDAEGREVTFPDYAMNAYEEVDTFPVPQVGEYGEANPMEDQPLVEQFQTEADPAPAGVSEETTEDDRGMGPEENITRAEFTEALRRIDRLERQANIA